ncbi:MAG: DmsE family decaheme c-type cytochrome [Burkholderiales bacterium]|jgi:DmsE family decaheme c-type cytochrome|nr:DmsE family decaheme c-type cytochrome [Burkholderiales bacterium]
MKKHAFLSFLRFYVIVAALGNTAFAIAAEPKSADAAPAKAEISTHAPVADTSKTESPADAQAANAPMTTEELVAQCAACHQEQYDKMISTRHGVSGDARTPWGDGNQCLSCHGKANQHIENPIEEKPETVFNKTTPHTEKVAKCLVCHQGGNRMHWEGGAHERANVACTDCHTMHTTKDQVTTQTTQAGVCFTCHKNIRAEIMRISTHPIRTGQMSCVSCHQPHGSEADRLMIKDTINDTCYTCHAEKRGPFLWEHTPVRDSCVNCHSPHGTNNIPLLKARRPQLCQQCHIPTMGHPPQFFSGSNLPPAVAADKMLSMSCQNCHTKIHGSNHPAGGRFTR